MNTVRVVTARGAATRARIVEAAARLMHLRGVGGTSLDEVLAASETSKSQLYQHFADKEALARAVIQAQADRVVDFQAVCLERVTSLAGLRRWRDAMIDLSLATGGVGGCPMGSLASELVDHSESARELLVAGFLGWERLLVAALSAMRDRGELGPEANPADLATAMLTAIQGGLLLAQTTRTTRPLELALDMALDHVERHAGLSPAEMP